METYANIVCSITEPLDLAMGESSQTYLQTRGRSQMDGLCSKYEIGTSNTQCKKTFAWQICDEVVIRFKF